MGTSSIAEGYIAGISFGYDLKRDDYFTDAPLRSLELLKECTGANTVVFAFFKFCAGYFSVFRARRRIICGLHFK